MSGDTVSLPTFPPRKSLTGCARCGAEVPLSPRYGFCAVHAEIELLDLALRKHTRAHTPRTPQNAGELLMVAYAVLCGALGLWVKS